MDSSKKITIRKNIKYSICSCGLSDKLPFCDNNHRDFNRKNNCSFKSVKVLINNKNEIELKCSNWKLNENIK